jgi:hypothetical protein
MCVHFEPFVVGYKLTRVNLGSIKNQSGGLDSGINTSIELSPLAASILPLERR